MKKSFWDQIFSLSVVKEGNLVIGGDLNFMLSRYEIWGSVAHVDVQSEYFLHKIKSVNLVDVEPIKLKPNWCNRWMGVARIPKRLDCFSVVEHFLGSLGRYRR